MRLYITNLSPTITEQSLEKRFGEYGEVLSIQLSRLNRAGSKTGVAILEMDPADAARAFAALNGQAFRNRQLYITIMRDNGKYKKPQRTDRRYTHDSSWVIKPRSQTSDFQ